MINAETGRLSSYQIISRLIKYTAHWILLNEWYDYAASIVLKFSDHSYLTIFSFQAVMYDISKHSNVWAWYQKTQKVMEQYGYKEIAESGANMIGSMFKRKVKIWAK